MNGPEGVVTLSSRMQNCDMVKFYLEALLERLRLAYQAYEGAVNHTGLDELLEQSDRFRVLLASILEHDELKKLFLGEEVESERTDYGLLLQRALEAGEIVNGLEPTADRAESEAFIDLETENDVVCEQIKGLTVGIEEWSRNGDIENLLELVAILTQVTEAPNPHMQELQDLVCDTTRLMEVIDDLFENLFTVSSNSEQWKARRDRASLELDS